MAGSNILISGFGGLGVEIAKNVVLSGVKSVTLHDTAVTRLEDLSSQFFLREDDIGKNRAEVTLPRLGELNSYVPLRSLTTPLSDDDIAKHQVIVLTDSSAEEQLRVSDACRRSGSKLIIAKTYGLFGQIFCDFGDKFIVSDPTGEEPASFMIANIEQVKLWDSV